MALWGCAGCTAAYAVGLACCPQCGSTERKDNVVPKILPDGTVTYEPGREPAGGPLGHPGHGEPAGEGIEHPADGMMSPEVGNEGDGEAGEQVTQLPPGETAAPVAPAASRTPPRRPPPATGSGGATLPKPGAGA